MTEWDHWLEYLVDGTSVRLVRPSDTDRPTWAAYEETRYLGTVHGRFDLDGRWHGPVPTDLFGLLSGVVTCGDPCGRPVVCGTRRVVD